MSTLPQLPTRPLSAPAAQQEKLDNQRFAMYVTNYVAPNEKRPACLTPAEGAAISKRYTTGGGRLAALTALVNARFAYWQTTKGYQPEKPLAPEQVQEARAFFAQVPPVLAAPAPAPLAPPVAASTGSASAPTNGETKPAPTSTGSVPAPAATGSAIAVADGPITWSVDYLDDGWPCHLTVPAISANAAIERGRVVLKALAAKGIRPGPVVAPSTSSGGAEAAPICAIHHTPMSQRQGKNGNFWSCPQKLEDGSYCPYKPKQKQG